MTKHEVLNRLKEMGLQGSTFGFYCTHDKETGKTIESSDISFGDCEISGVVGGLVNCVALGEGNKLYNVQVGTWLVHGHLGKIAGAF